MALKLGATTLTALYLGSTAIATAYLGSTEVYTTGGAFSPASLFASGEEGAWYEPSTTTAFLSTTDLTPCGYGDGCGLLLDKSQGAGYSGGSFTGLGSELVTNGTFDTDVSGWSNGAGASSSWTSGEIFVTGGSQFGAYQQLSGLTVGVTYYLSGYGRVGTGTNVRLRITSDTTLTTTRAESNVVTATGGNEEMSLTFTAQETNPVVYLRASGDGDTGYFDNISVKELPGNHATQVTAGARPILARVPESGRRNLLTYTEEFDNAYWGKVACTVDDNAVAGPDDVITADKHIPNNARPMGTSTSTASPLTAPNGVTSGVTYAYSVYAKAAEFDRLELFLSDTVTGGVVVFDLTGGTVVSQSNATGAVSDAGNGWWRCSLTKTAAATAAGGSGTSSVVRLSARDSVAVNGDGTSGIYIWGAQLETGSTATAYQKVVDEHDITEAGVTSLEYLSFNGASNGMATASIDFTATDKMSVFAGVESEADASSIITEMGNQYLDKNGAFILNRLVSGAYNYGLSTSTNTSTGFSNTRTSVRAAPDTVVLSFGKDLAGATEADKSVFSRVNGASDIASTLYSAPSTATAFLNLPLNIGARNNAASLWFNGKLFFLIVRGASSTTDEITNTEAYLAARSGVVI